MVDIGRLELPYEACGLLSGNDSHVKSLWPLQNEMKSVSRFFVNKNSVRETIQKIKKLEEQVLAIYHTHPITAPVPSSFDILNHPDNKVSMVIISYKTNPPNTKWYQIRDSMYIERPYYIIPQH